MVASQKPALLFDLSALVNDFCLHFTQENKTTGNLFFVSEKFVHEKAIGYFELSSLLEKESLRNLPVYCGGGWGSYSLYLLMYIMRV